MIYRSRFTPGVKGDKIKLEIDEKVKYELLTGEIIEAIIKSNLVQHHSGVLGYEAITLDDNKLKFIAGKRIVWWEGKMETMEELEEAMKNC
jgi:hypothetical protein